MNPSVILRDSCLLLEQSSIGIGASVDRAADPNPPSFQVLRTEDIKRAPKNIYLTLKLRLSLRILICEPNNKAMITRLIAKSVLQSRSQNTVSSS